MTASVPAPVPPCRPQGSQHGLCDVTGRIELQAPAPRHPGGLEAERFNEEKPRSALVKAFIFLCFWGVWGVETAVGLKNESRLASREVIL